MASLTLHFKELEKEDQIKSKPMLDTGVSHCNLNCLGGWDGEDHGSSQPEQRVHKTSSPKQLEQVVEHLFCKCEALNSNPSPTKTSANLAERRK
jgi:hypothetical protein